MLTIYYVLKLPTSQKSGIQLTKNIKKFNITFHNLQLFLSIFIQSFEHRAEVMAFCLILSLNTIFCKKQILDYMLFSILAYESIKSFFSITITKQNEPVVYKKTNSVFWSLTSTDKNTSFCSDSIVYLN